MNSFPVLLVGLLATVSSCARTEVPGEESVVRFSRAVAEVAEEEEARSQVEISRNIASIFQDQNGNIWLGSNDRGLYKLSGKSVVHYSAKHGLTAQQIGEIQADRNGFLFLTTEKGIVRFDGKTFETLKVEDSEGTWKLGKDDLWFKGEEGRGGVYRYDGNKLQFLKLPKSELHNAYFSGRPNLSFSPYDVYRIFRDRSGNMWFGTGNFGVCWFDGKSLKWLYEKQLTETPEGGSFGIRSVIEDRDGMFWICNTKYRFELLEQKTGDQLQYRRVKSNIPELEYFMSSAEAPDGAIWMVGGFGAWKYDGENVVKYPVTDEGKDVFVQLVFCDRDGGVWLIAGGAGLYQFNGKGFEKF